MDGRGAWGCRAVRREGQVRQCARSEPGPIWRRPGGYVRSVGRADGMLGATTVAVKMSEEQWVLPLWGSPSQLPDTSCVPGSFLSTTYSRVDGDLSGLTTSDQP